MKKSLANSLHSETNLWRLTNYAWNVRLSTVEWFEDEIQTTSPSSYLIWLKRSSGKCQTENAIRLKFGLIHRKRWIDYQPRTWSVNHDVKSVTEIDFIRLVSKIVVISGCRICKGKIESNHLAEHDQLERKCGIICSKFVDDFRSFTHSLRKQGLFLLHCCRPSWLGKPTGVTNAPCNFITPYSRLGPMYNILQHSVYTSKRVSLFLSKICYAIIRSGAICTMSALDGYE